MSSSPPPPPPPPPPPQPLTSDQHRFIRQAFDFLDTDGDSAISPAEVHQLMRRLSQNVNEAEIAALVHSFDLNSSGQIEFDEFVSKMERRLSVGEEMAELWAVFKMFDKNGDGYIDKEELKGGLEKIGEVMNEKEIEEVMKEADKDGDERINFDEFVEVMKK